MRGVGYATIEIVLLILAAAIIGFLIAWVLRRFLYDVNLGEYESRIQSAEGRSRRAEAELEVLREETTSAAEEIGAIQAKVADAERDATALAAELETARTSVNAKDGRIEQLESELAGIGADLAAARSTVGEQETVIEQLRSELAGLGPVRDEADARAARIAELEILVVERESSTEATERIASLQAELASADEALAESRARIAELERAGAAPAEPEPDRAPEAGDSAEPPSQDAAVAQMAEVAARTAGAAAVADDDLKKIHGVGPKLEQLLKAMGITSFRQIARFEAADIAVVTAALDAFPGRIERDDWMSSAAAQHREKHGEPA